MRVFLGGTCNESTWRDRIIKMLKAKQIDYFNPVVDDWNEAAQEQEIRERENCDVCLYVITPLMLGTYSIAEVVDDSNKRYHKTMLVLLQEDDGMMFSDPAWKSLKQVGQLVSNNNSAVLFTLNHAVDHLLWKKKAGH